MVLLTCFVQDHPHGRPDCDAPAFTGDCELLPPFLIMLLVSNHLPKGFISINY